MKLILNNKTSIYILCPANISTGGPKCLHQLGYEIKNQFKNKVYMYYFSLFGETFRIQYMKIMQNIKYRQ